MNKKVKLTAKLNIVNNIINVDEFVNYINTTILNHRRVISNKKYISIVNYFNTVIKNYFLSKESIFTENNHINSVLYNDFSINTKHKQDIEFFLKKKPNFNKEEFIKFLTKASENGEYIYELKFKVLEQEFHHIIDYLITIVDERINNGQRVPDNYFNKMSYKILDSKVKKWDEQRRKKKLIDNEKLGKDVRTFIKCKSGRTWVRLLSEKAYQREAFLLNHCVDSYVNAKDIEVYSLREVNNKPLCTLSISQNVINQIYGFNNEPIDTEKYKGADEDIIDFINKKRCDVGDNVLRYYGIVSINESKTNIKNVDDYTDRNKYYLLKNITKVKKGSIYLDRYGQYISNNEKRGVVTVNPINFKSNSIVSILNGSFIIRTSKVVSLPKLIKVDKDNGFCIFEGVTLLKEIPSLTIDCRTTLFNLSARSRNIRNLNVKNSTFVFMPLVLSSYGVTKVNFLNLDNYAPIKFNFIGCDVLVQDTIPNIKLIISKFEESFDYSKTKTKVSFIQSSMSSNNIIDILVKKNFMDKFGSNYQERMNNFKYEIKPENTLKKYINLLKQFD